MIKMSNLILERFEIPPDLQKQLENTGYSALGTIISSQVEEFKKTLHSNKELNDKSYNSLKNVIDSIKMLTKKNGGNTTLTFKDVFVPEFFSTIKAKQITKKVDVVVEKSGDDIYVNSNEKKDKYIPDIVISKDSGGWDLNTFNKFWNPLQISYDDSQTEFDNKLVIIEQLDKKVKHWSLLDKPIKSKIYVDGQRMDLQFKKEYKGQQYTHYFRVSLSRRVDDYDSPDYFNTFLDTKEPFIVQTIYLDQFSPNTPSLSFFMTYVENFISICRHEGRHLVQFIKNKEKNINFYGTSKKPLRHPFDPTVRGTDTRGVAGSTAVHKDPKDKGNRVVHPFRDVEFKTNLYDYKENIENVLGKNFQRSKWQTGFRDLILYTVGKMDYSTFRKKFPNNHNWEYSVSKQHLEQLYNHDRIKFNQFIKELYKLIFV